MLHNRVSKKIHKFKFIIEPLFTGYPLLKGDEFYQFTCTSCHLQGKSEYKRLSLSWIDVVYIILYHLSMTEPGKLGPDNRKYYHYKKDICSLLDRYWNYFWCKPRTANWVNSVASCLSTNDHRFLSGNKTFENDQGLYALLNLVSLDSLESKKRNIYSIVNIDGSVMEPSSKNSDGVKNVKKKRKIEGEIVEIVENNDHGDGSIPSNPIHVLFTFMYTF